MLYVAYVIAALLTGCAAGVWATRVRNAEAFDIGMCALFGAFFAPLVWVFGGGIVLAKSIGYGFLRVMRVFS